VASSHKRLLTLKTALRPYGEYSKIERTCFSRSESVSWRQRLNSDPIVHDFAEALFARLAVPHIERRCNQLTKTRTSSPRQTAGLVGRGRIDRNETGSETRLEIRRARPRAADPLCVCTPACSPEVKGISRRGLAK
jgi:hypothetical protein